MAKITKKIILIILTCILVISVSVVVFLFVINGRNFTTMINGENKIELVEELTEEQYQLLKDSIFYGALEEMNKVERRNAWMFLNAMREKEFAESRYPGESGVSMLVEVLDLLDIGAIEKLMIVRLEQGIHELADVLIIRITNRKNNEYYVFYNRTWGVQMIRKNSENGEIIFNGARHIIWNGQIYEIN